MSRVLWVQINPFNGVAESAVTSNVFDLRDAVEWTFSWRTTSGTTSAHTLQLSNSSVRIGLDTVPPASFINDKTFGTGSPDLIEPSMSARYGRMLRDVSNATLAIEVHKLVG
jgi:hypothetical protein